MTWYIVGEMSKLGVTDAPPRLVFSGGVRSKQVILWPSSSSVSRARFPVKRGRAEEFRTYFPPHERTVARVLPADAEPELLRLQEEIENAAKEYQAAKTRLQEFLAAQVPRAEIVKIPTTNAPESEIRRVGESEERGSS